MVAKHTPVLLNQAVEALISDTDGVYVDGTYGRGGHSFEINMKSQTFELFDEFNLDV